MEIGYIYLIRNKINGKFYLGSTKNLHKRKLKHFRDLRNQNHHSIYLQRSYNKYGIDNFDFIIIETSFNYLQREQELLNQIDFSDSYNISICATGGNFIHNHPEKDRLIKEASERLKNAPRPKPRYGKLNSNWRGGTTFCKCGKRINSNSNSCIKCKEMSGENNPFYGKHHSEETKEKIRQQHLGKYNGNQEKVVIIENVEYKSLSEASRILKINTSTILFRIKSNNKRFINYNYK